MSSILAPAGGWAEGDESFGETLGFFATMQDPAAGGDRVGTDDKLLRWPAAAAYFRHDRLPHADWIELEGIGHCPQLDIPGATAQLILGFTSR